jgi:hypothetical protein
MQKVLGEHLQPSTKLALKSNQISYPIFPRQRHNLMDRAKLIPVRIFLVWAGDWDSDIVGLGSAQDRKLSIESGKVESSDLLVKVLWEDVYLVLVLSGSLVGP